MTLRANTGQKHWPHELQPELIAPCGMDCGLCIGYLRDKDRCSGCRTRDDGKAKSVLVPARIRNCEIMLGADQSGFCGHCGKMPCPRLRRLDARYRAKYRMSMLENLRIINDLGVEEFIEWERERRTCPQCGGWSAYTENSAYPVAVIWT